MKVEKVAEKKGPIINIYLDISSKDGRSYRFKYKYEDLGIYESHYDKLTKMAFETKEASSLRYYEFNHQKYQETYGWKKYDIEREFKRQGLVIDPTSNKATKKVENLKYMDNFNGKVCSTYPNLIVVPSEMIDETILRSAKFRSRERIPVLTFSYRTSMHHEIRQTNLWRSSQCKVIFITIFFSLREYSLKNSTVRINFNLPLLITFQTHLPFYPPLGYNLTISLRKSFLLLPLSSAAKHSQSALLLYFFHLALRF